MAQQMEVGVLTLEVPETPDELMQHMQRRSELGGSRPGDLGEYTRTALAVGPEGILMTAVDQGEEWGVFPANTQTPEYMLALFKARTQLLRDVGAASVSVFDRRTLQPNDAISPELLARQLRATMEATEDPSVTMRVTAREALASLGARELNLVFPNGDSTPIEEVSAFTAVDAKALIKRPASDVPELVARTNGALDHE